MEGVTEAPRGAWIETYTGKQFFLENPQPEDVCIEDIAHALSNLCRFTGHVGRFYSAAEHSLLVMNNLPPKYQPWGLLHDAAEAYLGDVSRPLKGLAGMESYREIENLVMSCILTRFGLNFGSSALPPMVKSVDLRALVTERRDLMCESEHEWDIKAEPFEKAILGYASGTIEADFLREAKRLGLE